MSIILSIIYHWNVNEHSLNRNIGVNTLKIFYSTTSIDTVLQYATNKVKVSNNNELRIIP